MYGYDAPNAERQAHNEPLPYREAWPAFAAVIRVLAGTDQPSAVAKYLGHNATPQMVRDWRSGHSGIPAWVIETTRQRAAQWLANTIGRVTPGPGYNGDIHIRYGGKRKTPAT